MLPLLDRAHEFQALVLALGSLVGALVGARTVDILDGLPLLGLLVLVGVARHPIAGRQPPSQSCGETSCHCCSSVEKTAGNRANGAANQRAHRHAHRPTDRPCKRASFSSKHCSRYRASS